MNNILFEGQVPTFALDTVRERVEKVNKRAIKRGFPQVMINIGQTQMVSDPYFEHACNGGFAPISVCSESPRQVEYTQVEIAATGRLAMDGWRLVGVIAADAEDKDGNVIPMLTTVPGESYSGIIADAGACDHCKARRYRTETFMLAHDSGLHRQVGRQCLRDFLGHDPAAILAGLDAFRELMISESDLESWGRGAPMVWTKLDVIQSAARIVAVDGWYISKAKAIESQENEDGRYLTSTASKTSMLLMPPRTKFDREFNAEHPITPTVERIVANTIAALDNLKPNNDWEYKLAEYAKIERVGARHIGILASSVILGLRLEERKAKAAAKPESKHIGSIGERVTVEATLMFSRNFRWPVRHHHAHEIQHP